MAVKKIAVLIPTLDRLPALAVTLTSLSSQTEKRFDVIISNQSETDLWHGPSVSAAIRLLNFHNHKVTVYTNLPRQGMAQQRQFLLDKSEAPYSLFLDDDVMVEPWAIELMLTTLEKEQCGFVGEAVQGLSYLYDRRPAEESIEFWEGRVKPESITPKSNKWKRHSLHNAANLIHVAERYEVSPEKPRLYKVAWIGGCVMYDTEKLKNVGGFSFWKELPHYHAGEDVMAQLRVMKRFGGCGIIPSGVYHQELPTTIKEREVNAPEYLESKL